MWNAEQKIKVKTKRVHNEIHRELKKHQTVTQKLHLKRQTRQKMWKYGKRKKERKNNKKWERYKSILGFKNYNCIPDFIVKKEWNISSLFCFLVFSIHFHSVNLSLSDSKPQKTNSKRQSLNESNSEYFHSKGGAFGSTLACGPRNPSANPAQGKLVWAIFLQPKPYCCLSHVL